MDNRERRANSEMKAIVAMTVPPDLIDAIRLNYRLAKSAEGARIVIDHKLASFARVYLTAWTPSGEELTREKANKQALRVIKTIRKGLPADEEDAALCEVMAPMVVGMEPSRATFEAERKARRKAVEKSVQTLPAYEIIRHVNGFAAWGLGSLIGEAGDIGMYSGCRKLYKRLGLAPNDCYPRGEKSTGRMIPRMARGRIMGIIADPLLKAKAKNAYGSVYDTNKARHLEAGKTKGHAHNLARRAMVKALLHDVWRAWHGLQPDYQFSSDVESRLSFESHATNDLPSDDLSTGDEASHHLCDRHHTYDRPSPNSDVREAA